MHSSYLIFKMLLLDLFTHVPNTALYYGTEVWKAFIDKEMDLRWWKYVILLTFLASTRTVISRLQLPHFIFHGHTKVFFSVLLLSDLFSLMCCFAVWRVLKSV